jgi:hypothetical protein
MTVCSFIGYGVCELWLGCHGDLWVCHYGCTFSHGSDLWAETFVCTLACSTIERYAVLRYEASGPVFFVYVFLIFQEEGFLIFQEEVYLIS